MSSLVSDPVGAACIPSHSPSEEAEIRLTLSDRDLPGEELSTPYPIRAELESVVSNGEDCEADHGQIRDLEKITSINVGPPPDGGVKAWVQVLGGFFAFFNAFGVTNSFGVFQSYYKSTLIPDCSDSAISWIGSIQGCLVISGSLVVGRSTDAGYGTILITTGSFLASFAFMMTSLSTKYYQLVLAHGVCMGLGCSMLFMSSLAIVNTYFSKKKGMASGIVAAGSSLGAVIYPIMINRLIILVGFPWAARIMGFTVLAVSTICMASLRPRLPPRRDGSFVTLDIIADIPYQLVTMGILLSFMGAYVPIFYIQSYSEYKGVNSNLSLYVTSILAAGSLIGRLVPNYIADRIGALNTYGPVLLLNGIIAFCWAGVENQAGVIAFALFYGILSGGVVSLPSVSIASITPRLSVLGTRMGVSVFWGGLGLLAGSPIAGALLAKHNGKYLTLQMFAASTVTAAGMFVMVARFIVAKRKGTNWV